jgi:ubiquinone/menaquinone biosynthesis C-methylase UbiE
MTHGSGAPAGVSSWEAAYLRFETPDEEIRKFVGRLREVGAESWPHDARVLDLFSGRGNGMVALEQLGFTRTSGVDLSINLVRHHEGQGPCVVADCRWLPVRSGSQDIAIVQGGLHHVPDVIADLPLVVAEVRRVLKPGGRFVVIEPWLTPFLRAVHWACESPARRVWPRLDALATMIHYERQTYERWLSHPAFVLGQLSEAFVPEIIRRRWGKLVFVGRPRP